jgi:uncharacterized damage-inducible protein DinB
LIDSPASHAQDFPVAEEDMHTAATILALFEEAFEKKAWHGPNLWQSLKGVSASQAAWRPAPGRHNIWEETLHAAYWKYAVRRRLEGGKRGGFVLLGSNFFPRPESGKLTEAAWKADKEILRNEHETLRKALKNALRKPLTPKLGHMLWGISLHDVYHAGQIRLLRRLMERT